MLTSALAEVLEVMVPVGPLRLRGAVPVVFWVWTTNMAMFNVLPEMQWA